MGGKIFCMCYALIGIPLTIVMFQSIGERLNMCTTHLLKYIKRCLKFKDTEVSQSLLIITCMNMSSGVVAVGMLAFAHLEGWGYVDSFYYCFITLTTIGFGDFVALQKNKVLQKKPEYVAFSLVFILFGLTVISAAMNLMVLRFLTMNTEDERHDEEAAAAAAKTAVRLEGDVITANGSLLLSEQQDFPPHDLTSVCSCSCYPRPRRSQLHYTVTRSPGHITHLLPPHDAAADADTLSVLDVPLQYPRHKRNSI